MKEQIGFWIACLILLLIVAMGCVDPNVGDPSIQSKEWDVTEIKLKDGTQCAVMDGYYSGGITCNWEAKN